MAGVIDSARRLDLQLRELTGLDEVDEGVPRLLVQDDEIPRFTDPDLRAGADDFDLGTGTTRRAERNLGAVHRASPPSLSMWGQIAETQAESEDQPRKMPRSSSKSP